MTKSSLPKGWRCVKFGDVVDNMNETTRDPEAIGLDRVVGLDHIDPESLPLKRWDNLSDLHEGTSFTRVFRAGQVLFGKRRAYQRKVSLPDFDGICSGDILVFQPKNTALLSEFLPYLVQSDGFFDHALGTSAGSLSPRTKWQELAKYEFALPPISEQERIVGLIGGIDKTIDSYLAARIEVLKKAVLSEFFNDPKVKFLNLPLSECANIDMGQSPAGESYNITGHGMPFLQGSAEFGIKHPRPVKWTTSPTKIVEPGDLLISVRAPVGDVNFADQLLCIGRGLARIRETKLATAGFLALALQYAHKDLVAASGTGMFSSISGANLKKIMVKVPSIDKQLELEHAFALLENVSESVESAVVKTRFLRRACLNEFVLGETSNV